MEPQLPSSSQKSPSHIPEKEFEFLLARTTMKLLSILKSTSLSNTVLSLLLGKKNPPTNFSTPFWVKMHLGVVTVKILPPPGFNWHQNLTTKRISSLQISMALRTKCSPSTFAASQRLFSTPQERTVNQFPMKVKKTSRVLKHSSRKTPFKSTKFLMNSKKNCERFSFLLSPFLLFQKSGLIKHSFCGEPLLLNCYFF